MSNMKIIWRFSFAISMVCGWWISASSTLVEKESFDNTPVEHVEHTLVPDKQISELTQKVAARLPHIGAPQRQIVQRNFIDHHLFQAMVRDNIPHAPLSNDYEFARRVYLDLTRRIPTTEQLASFVNDVDEGKRDRLIDHLLETQYCADHWTACFGTPFRHDADRTENASTNHFDELTFAHMLASHPPIARATINLVWKQFFGLGMVEPVDDLDRSRQDPQNPPSVSSTVQPRNAMLQKALAGDFANNGFSLKHLTRTITRSSAYQLSSRFDGQWRESYTPYFARHYVHLLTVEQIHNAVTQATQVARDSRNDMSFSGELQPKQFCTEVAASSEEKRAKLFLHTFDQTNGELTEPRPVGSILQAKVLIRSPYVTQRVRAEGGSLVDRLVNSQSSDEAIVDELYLATLSRRPLPKETRLALDWLEGDRQRGAEDVQWSLLNKLDFIVNY